MNISKFTQSSMAAINNCEKIAMDYGNQEIREVHLLYSLLTLDDSLMLKLIEKMGIDKSHFLNRTEEELNKCVKVQGGEPRVGRELNKVLTYAEDEAKAMGDEYVSVEHIFLSMIKYPDKEFNQLLK